MAKVQIFAALDMHAASTVFGTLTAYDASHIVITAGSFQGTYTGTFTYDNAGNVFGTLTGYSTTNFSVPQVNVSGLDVSAHTAAQLINSNQLQTFFGIALAGNDQFTLQAGTHVIDGYGGYNTVRETSAYSSSAVSNIGSLQRVTSSGSNDTLYNIQGIYFSDGFYNTVSSTFSPSAPTSGFAATDVTTSTSAAEVPQTYSGPVDGVQKEYNSVTAHNLNVSTTTDNWFIHTGSGTDAINVHGGTNVLDGGTGSNFLTGGNGFDTFFVDDRGASADIWSTVNNFHSGDAATIWGVRSIDFTLTWVDGQGAAGYTGLTLHATAPGAPTASLTLVGFNTADLTNGRLTVEYGTTAAVGSVPGSPYMYIHAT